MDALIVAGGQLTLPFLQSQIQKKNQTIIAVDRGAVACASIHVRPHIIVGDFDSIDVSMRQSIEDWEQKGSTVLSLNPIKDDTDTEYALGYALDEGAHAPFNHITIIGMSGGRIDHLLGNITILGLAIGKQCTVTLLDEYNRIYIAEKSFECKKNEQYGTYVSFFSFGQPVECLSLEGFRYSLLNHTLTGYHNLCLSNEIVADTAKVIFNNGILLVVESKDAF